MHVFGEVASIIDSISIVLADDHTLVRAAFRSLLESFAGIRVVGEAGDGMETLRLIKETRPDIALVDIFMPGLNGLEVTSKVAREFPRVRVVILSGYSDEVYVREALRLGAMGYLLKGSGRPEELLRAVHRVAAGETYISERISCGPAGDYVEEAISRAASGEVPYVALTPRQREVLVLIAGGYTTRQIAERLNISFKTADIHRTQLMERLDIHDIAGLVRYAIKTGLVRPD